MNCRPFLPVDYEMLCVWWRKHGWSPVPLPALPEGVTVEGRAAGFLYRAVGVPYGMIEWVVANPENSPVESYKAVDMVLKELIKMAEQYDILALQGNVYGSGLPKIYEHNGFILGDEIREATLILGE